MAFSLTITLAKWAIRRPYVALTTAIGLCCLLAIPAVTLRLDGDARRLLPTHDPAVIAFTNLTDYFGASEQTVLTVSLPASASPNADQRDRLWAAIDHAGHRLRSLTWIPDATQPAQPCIRQLVGLPDADLSAAIEDRLVPLAWLVATPEHRQQFITALNPRRVERRLSLGARPDTPPHVRERDPLGLWTTTFIPTLQQQLSTNGPLQRSEGHLVSRDNRTAILIAHPVRPAQDPQFTTVYAAQLQTIVADLRADPRHAGLEIDVVGGHVLAAADYATAHRAALTTGIQGSLGVLLLFALIFRNFRLVLFLICTLLPASAAALGVARLALGPDVSLLIAAFAVVLIGLGVDFTIHLDASCARRRAAGESPADAALGAVTDVGASIRTGALTSIAAFLVLLLSDFRGLRELGFVAAAGLTIMLMQVCIAAPAYLSRWSRPARWTPILGAHCGRWLGARRWPGTMLLIAILGIVAGAGYLSNNRPLFDGSARNLRPADDPLFARQRDLAQRFGLGMDYLHILIHAHDPEHVLAAAADLQQRLLPLSESVPVIITQPFTNPLPQRLAVDSPRDYQGRIRITTAHGDLIADGLLHGELIEPRWLHVPTALESTLESTLNTTLSTTLSPATIRPLVTLGEWQLAGTLAPAQQFIALDAVAHGVDWDGLAALRQRSDPSRYQAFWQDIDRWHARSTQRTLFTPNELADSPLAPLMSSTWTTVGTVDTTDEEIWLDLRLHAPDLGAGGLRPRDIADHVGIARDGGPGPASTTVAMTGVPVIAEALAESLQHDFRSLGLWSLAILSGILWWQLRGLRAAALIIGALLVGGILTQSLMILFEVQWNIINVAALPLLFGLGIDAAIYVTLALRRQPASNTGCAHALSEVTPPLCMTTATTILGFASFLGNPYRGLQSLGMVAIIGMISFFIIAVAIIPLTRRRTASPPTPP